MFPLSIAGELVRVFHVTGSPADLGRTFRCAWTKLKNIPDLRILKMLEVPRFIGKKRGWDLEVWMKGRISAYC